MAPAAPRGGFRTWPQRLRVHSRRVKSGCSSSSPPGPRPQSRLPRAQRGPSLLELRRRPRRLQTTEPSRLRCARRRRSDSGGPKSRHGPGIHLRPRIHLEPCEATLSLHPERPSDLSASWNLPPRTGSCAPQVLSPEASFREKQQKIGTLLP